MMPVIMTEVLTMDENRASIQGLGLFYAIYPSQSNYQLCFAIDQVPEYYTVVGTYDDGSITSWPHPSSSARSTCQADNQLSTSSVKLE
jgi:hypothetical protein